MYTSIAFAEANTSTAAITSTGTVFENILNFHLRIYNSLCIQYMIVLLAIGELLLYPSFSLTVCCFSRKQLSLYCKITSWCLILVHMKVVSYPVSINNARREVTRSFGCMINPLADLQNFNPEVTGSLHGGVRPMKDISTNMTSATRWVRLQLSVCCNTYPLVT